jgi:K+-transporting ATPase KdpF subunit
MAPEFLTVLAIDGDIPGPVSYTAGLIIVLFLLGYLIYALFKPEKF